MMNNQISRIRIHVGFKSIVVFLFAVFFTGCGSIMRKMPIQMARSSQIDFYKQYYTFGEETDIVKAQGIVARLMGSKETWVHFTKKYARTNEEFLADIKHKRFYIQGSINLTTYLSPNDHDLFFVDATGRYAVVYLNRQGEKDVIFTADYAVKNIPFSIKNDILTKQKLKIKVSQVLIRHFTISNASNTNHILDDLPLFFEIKLEKVGKSNQVFRMKYEQHDGQPQQHDVYFEGEKIGYMLFDKLPYNNAKLFDLRGRGFLRKDYD
ncbi:MAG: hypothetical protein DWQ10_15170 [Calditrichaeota bacterium]|nr:MAG: hypothetical protein DWQ10_15170 [Calditrichota bacterium]